MAIQIRPYCEGDAGALLEAARESASELFAWMPWYSPEYAIAEAREWATRQAESFANEREFEFVITSEKGVFLGGCGLNHLNAEDRAANLGYWVRTSASGQGVAPTAVRLAVKWAFENTEIERIEIIAAQKNVRSQSVAQKAGGVREGIARSRILLRGQFLDAIVYSIIRSDSRAAEVDAQRA
jgi:ribosomal-protein-serine acetyltransferase